MPLDISSISAEEAALLAALREDKSLNAAPDEMCVRFLRARDLDLARATPMLHAHLAWRREWQPESITTAQLRNSLPSGCWRFAGFARGGEPVLSVRTELWNPEDYDMEEYIRYLAWCLLQAEQVQGEGVSRNVVIFDVAGWKLSHVAYLSYIKELATLQANHNPERLAKAFLVNVPWIFHAAWAVIRPWLDAKTADKVVLDPTAEQLAEWIEPANLERCFHGGQHDDYPIPNFPGIPNMGEGDGPCGPTPFEDARTAVIAAAAAE